MTSSNPTRTTPSPSWLLPFLRPHSLFAIILKFPKPNFLRGVILGLIVGLMAMFFIMGGDLSQVTNHAANSISSNLLSESSISKTTKAINSPENTPDPSNTIIPFKDNPSISEAREKQSISVVPMANVIISAIAIIVSIITFIYSKIDSGNQEIRNRIDSGNQEIRSLINSSIRDYNNRIGNTNNRIDQVYQAPTTPTIDPS